MLGKLIFTNKIVAKNLGIEETKVEGVMAFVMNELGREIKECNHPYIYVKGLGTFTLKSSTLDKRLKALIHGYRGARKTAVTPARLAYVEGFRKEIMELFRIRRLLRTRRQENNALRLSRKSMDDCEGKLLQASTEK